MDDRITRTSQRSGIFCIHVSKDTWGCLGKSVGTTEKAGRELSLLEPGLCAAHCVPAFFATSLILTHWSDTNEPSATYTCCARISVVIVGGTLMHGLSRLELRISPCISDGAELCKNNH